MWQREAIVVHCPECNAALRVGRGATTTRCEYCGTEARVQRRTRVLQRPQAMPRAQSNEPPRVAREAVRLAGIAQVAFAVVVAVGLLTFVTRRIFSQQWMGGAPLIVDVDGDGVPDLVGEIRALRADRITIAAFSGVDGHKLWETNSLGDYAHVHSSRGAALADGVLVWAAGLGNITGYDLKSGKKRWSARAEDAIQRMCTGVPGQLSVRAATGTWWTLTLATGTLRPETAPTTCVAPARADPHASELDVVPTGALHVDGMSIQQVIAHGSGPKIALGWRTPGSGLTMLAAVDDSGATLWHVVVSTDDRWVAALSALSVVVDDRDVAVVYWHDSPIAARLAVFDHTSGTRRFDVALDKTGSTADGIALMPNAVAVSQFGNLQIYDRVTGHQKFVIP
ncbi:MAG TPA: PQQ-binding-like beta-propeller repeat protein [Kofleriaceae bacterium]|jgi:hypothetical protein